MTEIFFEALPAYIAYGMSCDEFWNGDPKLAIAYRKAYEHKQDVINETAWLYGLYTYDALCAVVGSLFGKRLKYVDKPIEIRVKEKTPEQIREEFKATLNALYKRTESYKNGSNRT